MCRGRHLSFLLVERYDRRIDAQGYRQRLHQEDFCQALGVVPEIKYQNEGGPDLAQCFELVRGATRPSAPQILRLLDYVIFNALIGNHDAHAKNFSLLHLGGKSGNTPILAPLYDTLSTAVYPTLTPNECRLNSDNPAYIYGQAASKYRTKDSKVERLACLLEEQEQLLLPLEIANLGCSRHAKQHSKPQEAQTEIFVSL